MVIPGTGHADRGNRSTYLKNRLLQKRELQIDFQGDTDFKAAFFSFKAHEVALDGVSNGGVGEAEGVYSRNVVFC